MRWMIDTNVILDVLLNREPFFQSSKAVLALCENRKVQGFVSASTITDIFYLTRKALHSLDETYQVIDALLNTVSVLTVTNSDVLTALQTKAKDFEDCLLAVCARSNHCDGIITRNKNDCLTFGLSLNTPEEFLNERKLST